LADPDSLDPATTEGEGDGDDGKEKSTES